MAFVRKPRIFILGMSGLIGNALAWKLRDSYDVIGAYFHNPVQIPNVKSYPVTGLEHATDLLESMIHVMRPDFTIAACGINDPKICIEQTKIAENINVFLPLSLAIATSKIKGKFINLSCSSIFDGQTGNYTEKNITAFSFAEYSKQKISAETFIRSQTLESTNLRLGRVVGLGSPFRANYFDTLRKKFSLQENISVSANKIHSYMSVNSVCNAIALVLENPIPTSHRLFHIGGPSMSEEIFAKLVSKKFHYDSSLIKLIPQDDGMSLDLSLDSTLFKNTYGWKEDTKDTLIASILQDFKPWSSPATPLPKISQTP